MKKRYRFISLFLVVLICTTYIPADAYAAPTKSGKLTVYEDSELARAVSLGIGTYEKNTIVNYRKFFLMLDKAIEIANPKALTGWKKKFPEARKSNKTMKRDEGMLAIFYASRMMGENYNIYNIPGDALLNKVGDGIWKEMLWDYPLFPGWNKVITLGIDKWNNHMIAAYFYNMCRMSITNDNIIFDYDTKRNSMRLNKAFTYEEALRAVVRLYDSGLTETERIKTAADTKLFNAVDARREAIINSKTDIVVNGISYYISNSGNDNNDGLSPNTAWATIDRANSLDMQVGDAVFLERGGVFRGILRFRHDITYSAYGEGDKPKILGSPENGNDPSKWTLLEGTKNIWVFYKDIYEAGVIVFNDGKSWADREVALWNGSKYLDATDKKTPVNIKKLKNLTFFQNIDYTGYTLEEAIGELNIPGKIYLRCDSGNPGKVYDSIEFASKPYGNPALRSSFVLQVGENCTIDNLCLMYCQAGISIGGNCTVQNCEVSWIGGTVAGFNGATLGTDKTTIIRFGDGILCAMGANNTVLNNYVHHMYDNGITIETGDWFDNKEDRYVSDTSLKGNLVEKCSGGFLIADFEALQTNRDSRVIFKNITIEDNYSLYSGYGWSHQELDYYWGYASEVNGGNSSLTLAFPPNAAQNIEIKNNVFYLGKYALVSSPHGAIGFNQLHKDSFSGNTYIQNTLGILIYWQAKDNYKYSQPFLNNFNAKKTVTDILGDKKGIVW